MSKAKLTRSLPTRYKELCLDLLAATDRWENEGGRTQLAQQEEVNLTLSSTTTIEPRSEQLVRRCFLRQANCSDTAYRWLDRAADPVMARLFPCQLLAQGAAKSRWSVKSEGLQRSPRSALLLLQRRQVTQP